MVMTFESLGLGEVDSGIVLTKTPETNPFQRFGRKVSLPQTGTTVTAYTGIVAQGLGEGEEKLASGTAKSIPMGANKIQSTIVETEEFYKAKEDATWEVVSERFPSAIAKATAAHVAGLLALPTGWSNFSTFADVEEVEVGTGAEAAVDFDDALARIVAGADGVIASTAGLNYLRRQRIGVTGQRVFEIDGDQKTGTIEHLPYATFASNVPVIILGAWDNYVWGEELLSGINDEIFRVYTSGNQKDVNGVTHNLNAENKVAIRYEEIVGSAIADLDSFVKLVPAAS